MYSLQYARRTIRVSALGLVLAVRICPVLEIVYPNSCARKRSWLSLFALRLAVYILQVLECISYSTQEGFVFLARVKQAVFSSFVLCIIQ